MKKRPFLLQITAGHRSVRYSTDLPPPSSLPFKVVPPSFGHGLVLLATFIRGGGGITTTKYHGQANYAKRRYSVSSAFATGCS